jgi:exopolysaccharide biosynthesis polyprenyl glycosylphosphotransferase
MTVRRLFRGFRGDQGHRPGRAMAAGGSRWLSACQAVRRCPAFIRRAVLPICDVSALLIAALLTSSGRSGVVYALAVLVLLRLNGRHRLRICLRVSDEVASLAVAAALPAPLLLFFMTRGGLVRLAALSGGLLVAVRLTLYAMLRAAHKRKWLIEPVLIVGAAKLGVEIWELLQEHTELGLQPVGFIDSPGSNPHPSLPLLGAVSELPDVVLAYDVRLIIIAFPEDSDGTLVSSLRADQQLSAEVCVVPRMHELAAAVPASYQDDIWGIPLILLRRCGLRWSSRVVKRAFDIVVGGVLLLVFSPVLMLLMGGILVSCGRPVLFRQVRVTRSGRIMKITKLRTVAGADSAGRWTVAPEDLSALGRWLRATHLDELPQLLNVVRGEMSLVGPRPERPYFTSRFAETVPRYDDRHRTNGGMTGWAQVHGLIGDTSIHERARFDNNYIEHWSLWLDLVILVRTLAGALTGARRKSTGPAREARLSSKPVPASRRSAAEPDKSESQAGAGFEGGSATEDFEPTAADPDRGEAGPDAQETRLGGGNMLSRRRGYR